MEVNSVSSLSTDMARILQMMNSKQTEMSEKIIKMEASLTVEAQQSEVRGQILDIYA
jgi:hypothetical protein